jgi:type II secretory ATPase GspE/PulE/Tfp pilus assembly ATPase PilB-like protein
MALRLGELLLAKELLSREQLERAQQAARKRNESLFKVLIRDRLVPEAQVLGLLAEQHHLAFVRLRELTLDPAAVKAVSAKFAAHYHIMPIRLAEGVLTLAVSNPFDTNASEDLETTLGYRTERVLACESDIAEAIRRHYGVGAETVERILADLPEAQDMGAVEEAHDLERAVDDASVVKLVNQILHQAIADRATDIHLELYRGEVTVRRRIDGILFNTQTSRNIALLYPAMVARVKLMAGLNIVERRLPQDGRARVKIGARDYDLRVSVVPTLHGENVVIRILPTTMLFNLEQLGLSPRHLELLAGLLRQPHGIVFVTGPTGSGKSTTLYACLSRLNTPQRKIITIEDPVEYELKGVTQTQINPRIDLTFARALRSMLRHDPNIMMVGEVRDAETAEITIQTALTGHLVFSTLHTNDAASAAVRLIDMGIDPYLITSTVRAFIAQRLVRTICGHCRESYTKDGQRFYRGQGCAQCNHTGFMGRIAIYEFLLVSREIQELILRKASATEIRDRAAALGMTTLANDGWEKVAQGITTAEEVLRVTMMPET